LLEELAHATLSGNRKQHMELLTTVPLLIVDDLGMRRLPLAAVEELLEIIMRRYERASELPFSSTLNGSCTNVCPVKINIHDQIYAWREVMEAKNQIKFEKKEAMIVADKVLANPRLYRIAAASGETALSALPRFALYNTLNAWGRHRELPIL
jgi:L-lactate utilization protein LutB